MAIKTIDESPTLIDTIKFVLKTPGVDGCLLANPYQVKNVTIYFVSRDFVGGNFQEYDQKHYDPNKLQAAEDAESLACETPTPENITNAQALRAQAELSVTTTTFYYNEAVAVASFGNATNPAWIGSVLADDNILVNTAIGTFELYWEPLGMREGQYFICWTWQPNLSGDSLTDNLYFSILSSPEILNLPQHRTDPDKYTTLLDRYTPEMFKIKLGPTDLTPTTIDNFNKSAAQGFTVMEDLGTQIIDLLDANVVNESFLPYLANMFNLKLKSQDPTLWRRQIKRAVPLYKKKGTLLGLQEAFSEAGFNLISVTRLWQVISNYTWVEGLNVEFDGETTFTLAKVVLSGHPEVDDPNFELYIRPTGEDDFVSLSLDYVSFSTSAGVTTMNWVGESQPSPITLMAGDTLKIIYQVREVPSSEQQTLETYVRTLPLADQRDDRDQEYPLKNWNVRVIEENDLLINLIIPTRHPFENKVIFGQVRTEFPLSENLYNMDEFDGSLRDSRDPCDIDKNFIDCCTACLGSKFNITLEIRDISDDRLHEAQQILEEYKPFHAILQTLNFSGLVEEFINCNVEDIEILIKLNTEESVLTDTGNIFSRAMQHASLPNDDAYAIKRNMLNDLNSIFTGARGTLSSEDIVLYAPNVDLSKLNINNYLYNLDPEAYTSGSNQNRLEIFAPHTNAGTYVLSGEITEGTAKVDLPPEPFSTSAFTFRISNIIYSNTVSIDPVEQFVLSDDSDLAFIDLDVISQWQIDKTGVGTTPWRVEISAVMYDVLNVNPDGTLNISGGADGWSGTYSLYNSSDEFVQSSTGTLASKALGLVTVGDSISDLIRVGDYVVLDPANPLVQQKIQGFVEESDSQFYIDYSGASVVQSVDVFRRLTDTQTGYLDYRGIKLVMSGDYETSLGIINGASAPNYPFPEGFLNEGSGRDPYLDTDDDHFRENFLVRIDIDDSTQYFVIKDINGNNPPGSTTFILTGTEQPTWPLSGTAVLVSMYRATKKAFSVPEQRYTEGIYYIQNVAPDSDPANPTVTDSYYIQLTRTWPPFDYTTPGIGGPPISGIDRRGKDLVSYTYTNSTSLMPWGSSRGLGYGPPMPFRASALNAANKNQNIETIDQQESITFTIDWAKGSEEGKNDK